MKARRAFGDFLQFVTGLVAAIHEVAILFSLKVYKKNTRNFVFVCKLEMALQRCIRSLPEAKELFGSKSSVNLPRVYLNLEENYCHTSPEEGSYWLHLINLYRKTRFTGLTYIVIMELRTFL